MMAVYDVQGASVITAYGHDGDSLDYAYDKGGIPVYEKIASDLRAMTYNVGYWYEGTTTVPTNKDAQYYALQSGMFQRDKADVLTINEYRAQFSPNRTAESVLAPYFDYMEFPSDVVMPRGICSKYALTDYTINSFSVNRNRYYDKAYITVKGKRIAVFTTHMDSVERSYRLQQSQQLIQALKQEEYFIVGGDFNFTDISNGYTTNTEDYQQIVTLYLAEGFHLANWSTFGFLTTYIDGDWYGCLDNIITSSNIDIVNVCVDQTKLNDGIGDKVDHMPLIADLVIN